MERENVSAVLQIVKEDRDFRATVARLGGYDISDMGKTMYET
jgi:hypothetical protein